MSLIHRHPQVALWGATLIAVATMTLLVRLTEDGPVLAHWPEIGGVGVGVHVVVRAMRSRQVKR